MLLFVIVVVFGPDVRDQRVGIPVIFLETLVDPAAVITYLADLGAFVERIQVPVDELLRSHGQSVLVPDTSEVCQLCKEARLIC